MDSNTYGQRYVNTTLLFKTAKTKSPYLNSMNTCNMKYAIQLNNVRGLAILKEKLCVTFERSSVNERYEILKFDLILNITIPCWP